jgi:hypothetical protein
MALAPRSAEEPPTWFGYLIATIQLVGGLAILAGFKTRWVAYALLSAVFIVYGWFAFADIKAWVNFNQAAFVAYLLLVDLFAHNFWDMQEYTMVTLYHRTTEVIARLIVVDGFRDGEGYYGTEYLHSGARCLRQLRPLRAGGRRAKRRRGR